MNADRDARFGDRLRAARRMVGFSSAAKAAAAIGMARGTYAQLEYARLVADPPTVRRLADALGVSEDFLTLGTAATSTDEEAAAYIGMDEAVFVRLCRIQRLKAGGMLRALRTARGFSSAASASEVFGFVPSTYRSHEAGVRVISPVDRAVYEYAFDAPSHLLDVPDATIEGLSESWVRRDAKSVAAFRESLEIRRKVPEIVWTRRYESLKSLVSAIDVGGSAVASTPVPMTRDTLSDFALGDDIAIVRGGTRDGRAPVDLVLRMREGVAGNSAEVLSIRRGDDGRMMGTLGGNDGDPRVLLRLPVLAVIAVPAALATVKVDVP